MTKFVGLLSINEDGFFKEIKFPLFAHRVPVTLCKLGDEFLYIKEERISVSLSPFYRGVILALGIFDSQSLSEKEFCIIKLKNPIVVDRDIQVLRLSTNSVIIESTIPLRGVL